MADDDLFTNRLLGCEWRGRGFPCSSFDVSLTQALVEHERPDQDGARVEATGRKALKLTAKIPWLNGTNKGPNESWGDIPLYPDGHKRFFVDMADRTIGTLQHPSLGSLVCRPSSFKSSLAPAPRDGEVVHAEWTQTIRDDEALLASIFTSGSPIAAATSAATNVDAQLALTNFGGFDPDDGKISFADALRKIAGVFDKATLLNAQAFGVINRLTYRINAIGAAVASARDPQNWPLKAALLDLAESLRAVAQAAAKGSRDVSFFVTPVDATLASIATHLNSLVLELILLNPELVKTAVVPADTIVRYYPNKVS